MAALRLLAGRKYPQLDQVIASALADGDPRLRAEARDVLADRDAPRALAELQSVLDRSSAPVIERQRALTTLARMKSVEASAVLDRWADRLSAAKVAPDLLLDVLEALRAESTAKGTQALRQFEAALKKDDPLARFRMSLRGGSAERGRDLFVGHAGAQCIRCHSVHGDGGNAGPDLTKVASRYPQDTREFLLESMILPNAKIAPGYGSVTLVVTSGRLLAGTLQAEDATSLTLQTPDGQRVKVAKKDIDERTPPTSAMPAMDQTLSPRDLRDLVEYLMTLK
jgi:quinoprotein glucose dehydrogenase